MKYKVTQGYEWQLGAKGKAPWAKIIWARSNIPSHVFISWIFVQYKLLTKKRLARFKPQQSLTCSPCNTVEDDEAHLFYTCSYAKEAWDELGSWWKYIPTAQNSSHIEPVATL